MLFSCILPNFYGNLHNFWTHNYFHINFAGLVSKYLLYKHWKFWNMNFWLRVTKNSLGGYFFMLCVDMQHGISTTLPSWVKTIADKIAAELYSQTNIVLCHNSLQKACQRLRPAEHIFVVIPLLFRTISLPSQPQYRRNIRDNVAGS